MCSSTWWNTKARKFSKVAKEMRKAIAVANKEVRQIVRDRRTLMILVFVPAMFLLLYGYALNFDIRDVPLAVEDRDRSVASRKLISAFVNSGYFDLVADVTSYEETERLIDRNEVRLALVIPERFGEDVAKHRPADVQVLVNGENSTTAATVVAYAQAIVSEADGTAVRPPIALETQVWYNPQLRSTLFLVPGLIAYISMITAVISTALSIVREKERGTIEQVRMAPVGPASFIAGKTLPYLVLSFVSAVLIIVVAMLLFELPMRGSWLMLSAAIALFVIGAQAQGLLISSIAPTQQVAFQLALLSSFLPTFILSGFIFPITSMPAVVQAITYVIPARYFLVALRAIVLKGSDFWAFWWEMAALGIFAAVALTLASVRLGRGWRTGI
jgi:ABC-2 type transport system permease protein